MAFEDRSSGLVRLFSWMDSGFKAPRRLCFGRDLVGVDARIGSNFFGEPDVFPISASSGLATAHSLRSPPRETVRLRYAK